MKAFLKSQLWFDKADLADKWESISFRLTSKSKYDSDSEEEATVLHTWEERGSLVGLPIRYGIRVARALGISIVDETVLGESVSYTRFPTPRNEDQGLFFTSLLREMEKAPSVLAIAQTGTGKTVAALNAIANLGRTAIVVVPSRSLALQWTLEAKRHIGLSDEDIHVFQGGDLKWKGYKLVIAVIHNLCEKKLPREFYSYFGIAVWDEAHKVGAKVFSQSIKRFPAHYRVALTATPNRKDGRSSILYNAFGNPSESVEGNEMKAQPVTVHVVKTECTVKARPYGSTVMQLGALISAVSKDERRNQLCLEIILKAYNAGRNLLVISDRIDQLKWFKAQLAKRGVAKPDIGLFIGGLSDSQITRIKAECPIVLSTYGMMKEGQDIPRLSFGIDATPRSEGEQTIGRIRRVYEGKPSNVWVTLLDEKASAILKGISTARIKDFKQCGAQVKTVKHITEIPY